MTAISAGQLLARNVKEACVVWRGPTANGRPIMKIGGRYLSARREIYRSTHGFYPDGPTTTTCGHPSCVNPAHVVLVREITTHCRHGHEYTAPNTRWRTRADKGEKRPSRECRTCWNYSKHGKKTGLSIGLIAHVYPKAKS